MKGYQEKLHKPDPAGRMLSIFRNDGRGKDQPRVMQHWHDYLELLVLEEGSCDLDLEQQTIRLQAGDLFLIGACTGHSIRDMSGCLFWVMQFAKEWLYDLSGPELSDLLPFMQSDKPGLAHLSLNDQPAVRSLLQDIERDDLDQPPAMALSVRGSLLKLFACLIRQQKIHFPVSRQEALWLEQLQPALEYVRGHYSENISEKEIAAICYLSQSHFSRIFRQITGQKFMSYLHFLRLQEGRRLLATTGLPVARIASDIGFTSPSHFASVFRQASGLTPLAYRKKNFDRT